MARQSMLKTLWLLEAIDTVANMQQVTNTQQSPPIASPFIFDVRIQARFQDRAANNMNFLKITKYTLEKLIEDKLDDELGNKLADKLKEEESNYNPRFFNSFLTSQHGKLVGLKTVDYDDNTDTQ